MSAGNTVEPGGIPGEENTADRAEEAEEQVADRTGEHAGEREERRPAAGEAATAGLGGHRLIRRLGTGGFGDVHLAEHPDGRTVALEVAAPGADPGLRDRLARAVELARRMPSVGVARVLDADTGGAVPWVATEYVEGPTLAEVVEREGPYTDSDLYRVAVGIATVLAAVHAVGAVHGGLTPEHIVPTGDGPRVTGFPGADPDAGAVPADDVLAWARTVAFAATGRWDGRAAGELAGPLGSLVESALSGTPDERPTADRLVAVLLGYGSPGTPGTPGAPGAPGAPGGSAPAVPGHAGPGVYRFAGYEHTDALSLAETMQIHWDETAGLLRSDEGRRDLRAWLRHVRPVVMGAVDRPPDEPAGVDLRVARLISVLGPELTPCFRRHDMALERILTPEGRLAPWVLADPELRTALEAGLLEELSVHHCGTPEAHGCAAGEPCARYIEAAHLFEPLLAAASSYRDWSRELTELCRARRFEPDYEGLMDDYTAPGRPDPLDGEAVAAWAADRAGRSPGAEFAGRAVERAVAERRWAAAVVAVQVLPVWESAHERHGTMEYTEGKRRIGELERLRDARLAELTRMESHRSGWGVLFGIVLAVGALALAMLRFGVLDNGDGALSGVLVLALVCWGAVLALAGTVHLWAKGAAEEVGPQVSRLSAELHRARGRERGTRGSRARAAWERVGELLRTPPP